MNLLFAINHNFIPLLLNCVKSIVKNGGYTSYDIYVLHSDLTEDSIQKIENSADKNVVFHFVNVDPDMFKGFPVTKRYPLQIYYRIAAPKLLPSDLDRILYLDADTVIINSLKPLYEKPFDGAYYMACTHIRKLLSKINQARLGIAENVPYINTGVMMMNLTLLREKLDMDAVCKYANQKRNVLLLPDQDIITALYGDKVALLDCMIYNLSDRMLAFHNSTPGNSKKDIEWVRNNTVVIHYCGRAKPWKEHYIGVLGIFYHEQS